MMPRVWYMHIIVRRVMEFLTCRYKISLIYQKAKELERQKSPSKTVDTPTTDIGLTGKVDGKAGYKVSLQFLI